MVQGRRGGASDGERAGERGARREGRGPRGGAGIGGDGQGVGAHSDRSDNLREGAGHDAAIAGMEAGAEGIAKVVEAVGLDATLEGGDDFRGGLDSSAAPPFGAAVAELGEQLPEACGVAGPQDAGGSGAEQGDGCELARTGARGASGMGQTEGDDCESEGEGEEVLGQGGDQGAAGDARGHGGSRPLQGGE